MRNFTVTIFLAIAMLYATNAHAWRIDLPGGGEWKGDDPDKVTSDTVKKVRDDPTKLIVNPMGYINTTGIPTQGDIFEFVVKNPDKMIELVQNPGQWPYLPVAAGIVSSRNAVIAGGGRPIPQDIKQALRRWYPDDLMNSVRWTSNWGPIQNTLQAAQMDFNTNTLAITVINAVVFRSDNLAANPILWAHELYHVQQYRDWGVFGFAKKWVDNSSVNGPVEAPAYEREAEARQVFGNSTNGQDSIGTPSSTNIPNSQPQGSMCQAGEVFLAAPGGACCTPNYSRCRNLSTGQVTCGMFGCQ